MDGVGRVVARILLFPLHLWLSVTFASSFFIAFCALGVFGLLVPDSWLDDRMRAKYQELQERGSRKRPAAAGHTAGLNGGSQAPGLAAGAESDSVRGEDGGGPAESPGGEGEQTESAKPSDGEQGTALTYKCAWCGGRKIAGEECCGYGMVAPEKIPWSYAKDFQGGSSSKVESKMQEAGDFAGSPTESQSKTKYKDKGNPGQQFMTLFRKLGKPKKKASAATVEKPARGEVETENLKPAGSQPNGAAVASAKSD